jgi:DNA-binding MarR family transcriptional regulator
VDAAGAMSEPNEIIHQTMRLKIMSALNTLPAGAQIEFTRLRALTQATDGNLGAHLATLETAGYVAIAKDFVGRKPRTQVAMTRSGRRAFADHVAYLKRIVEDSQPGDHEP